MQISETTTTINSRIDILICKSNINLEHFVKVADHILVLVGYDNTSPYALANALNRGNQGVFFKITRRFI